MSAPHDIIDLIGGNGQIMLNPFKSHVGFHYDQQKELPWGMHVQNIWVP